MKKWIILAMVVAAAAAVALLTVWQGGQEPAQPPVESPSSEPQEAPEEAVQQPKPTEQQGGPPPSQTQTPGEQSKPKKVKGLPGFASESDLIQHIWERFQTAQSDLKPQSPSLEAWLGRLLKESKEGEGEKPLSKAIGKSKDDPSFVAFMVALMTRCLRNPEAAVCQEPWHLTRFSVQVYGKEALSENQLEDFKRQIEARLNQITYVELSSEEAARTAEKVEALLFGEAPCLLELCPFDTIFPELSRLGPADQEKLLADLLDRVVERYALVHHWQPSDRFINVVIRKEPEKGRRLHEK